MFRFAAVLPLTLFALSCQAAPPPSSDQGADLCHAADYRYLVGQNRSKIPQKPEGATWRVYCSTCAVTLDYNPGRLDIVFDDKTGTITEVKCG